MKASKEHRVPLSKPVLQVLRDVPREKNNPFVFIGPYKAAGLSNMAMAATLQRMGRDDITVHGFRSTFRTWAGERTAHPVHVIEQALAHSIGTKVERAYARGDLFTKRARLMADWGKYCMAKPTEASAKVVPLRRGAHGQS
jgi:integrase